MARGIFLTFEGGDGGGKTTQLQLLAQSFRDWGERMVQVTREPGGTDGGEALRNVLLTGNPNRWDGLSETLLFYVARRDHVLHHIGPALKVGGVVLCDRFSDSTRVYQGVAQGISRAYLDMVENLTLGDLKPDMTVLLDVPPAVGLERALARKNTEETRFERKKLAFHYEVREGFLALARQEPERFAVIDATLEVKAVHEAIIAAVNTRFQLALEPQPC